MSERCTRDRLVHGRPGVRHVHCPSISAAWLSYWRQCEDNMRMRNWREELIDTCRRAVTIESGLRIPSSYSSWHPLRDDVFPSVWSLPRYWMGVGSMQDPTSCTLQVGRWNSLAWHLCMPYWRLSRWGSQVKGHHAQAHGAPTQLAGPLSQRARHSTYTRLN